MAGAEAAPSSRPPGPAGPREGRPLRPLTRSVCGIFRSFVCVDPELPVTMETETLLPAFLPHLSVFPVLAPTRAPPSASRPLFSLLVFCLARPAVLHGWVFIPSCPALFVAFDSSRGAGEVNTRLCSCREMRTPPAPPRTTVFPMW